MGDKDSFNLFDSSAHKSKKHPSEISVKASSPLRAHTPEQIAARREKLFEDPEVKEAIERMEKLNREIKIKYKELIEMGGFTPKSITAYLHNPKNFDAYDWETIQTHQEKIENSLGKALDPNYKEAKKKKIGLTKNKERKGKTLGGRKNWLDMH